MSTRTLLVSFFLLFPLIIGGCKEVVETKEPGPNWLTYRRPTNNQIPSNVVNSMTLGDDGRVWIATDSGVASFQKNSWGIITDSVRYLLAGSSTYSKKVNSISEARFDGSIWFGLAGGGAKRYRPNSTSNAWLTYRQTASGTITSVVTDQQFQQRGDVWFTTLIGISWFIPDNSNPETGQWYLVQQPTIPSNQVRCSAYNFNDNTVWFGTNNGAAYYSTNDEIWSTFTLPPPYDQYTISSIAFDRNNVVWLGTWGGVHSYDRTTSQFKHYTNALTAGKLPSNFVNVVAIDKKVPPTVWIGTNGGMVRVRDTTWTTYTTRNTPQLPGDSVKAITIDLRNNVWIGTSNGVAIFNENGTSF